MIVESRRRNGAKNLLAVDDMNSQNHEAAELTRLKMAVRMIEEQSACRLERPCMYHASPESLEDSFVLIDRMRAKLISLLNDELEGTVPGYSEFLAGRGYGSASICARKRLAGEEPTFDDVVTVWKAYVAECWNQRPTPAK